MIYFIACADAAAVKIGVTDKSWHSSPEAAAFARLTVAQANCPLALELIGLTEGFEREEKELHQRFAELRIRGEWFALTDELKDFVAQFPKPVRQPRGWHGQRRNRAEMPAPARPALVAHGASVAPDSVGRPLPSRAEP